MNARRHFIAALGASALAMPLQALAQQIPAKTRRIGILLFNSPQIDPIGPLLQGLQSLGYTDGKTVPSTTDLPMANSNGFRASPQSWYRLNQM